MFGVQGFASNRQLTPASCCTALDYYRAAFLDHEQPNGAGRQPNLPLDIGGYLQGSDSYYVQTFRDAIALCTVYGKPHLFITITANPNMDEVTTRLRPHQTPRHRPDLIARAFRGRLLDLTDSCHCTGLPHAHILVTLRRTADVTITGATIDRMISAELPDPDQHPLLHMTVTTKHIHGPCDERHPGGCGSCDEHGKR